MRISPPPPNTNIKYLTFCFSLLLLLLVSPLQTTAQDLAVVPASSTQLTIDPTVLIKGYDWDSGIALQIADKESGFNAMATNSTDPHGTCQGSYGLYQIGCNHFSKGYDIYNMNNNIQMAYNIYLKDKRSFREWSTCKLVSGCK